MDNLKKFKDENNRWRTNSLVKEFSLDGKYVLFSRDELKQAYMDCNDPTGYEFATNHLGGWVHWLMLKKTPKIGPLFIQWEEELEVKLRAMGVANMIEMAKSEKGYQASKFLVDKGWDKHVAGRPTKSAVKEAIKKKANEYNEFNNVVDLKKGN